MVYQKMSELNQLIEDVPQVLINCRVRNRKEIDQISGYQELIDKIGLGSWFKNYYLLLFENCFGNLFNSSGGKFLKY